MNREHPTTFEDVRYIQTMTHRNGNPQKSQWTINEIEERDCFEFAAQMYFIDGFSSNYCCWGLYILNKSPERLGKSAANKPQPFRDLFIAKFVDGDKNNKWHGYPADLVNYTQDIPLENILNYWMEANFFSAAKIRKMSRAQKCRI